MTNTRKGMTSGQGGPRMMASRVAPAQVNPIYIDGIRYEVVWGAAVLFRASEIKTGKVLWELTLYRYKYHDMLETDVQDTFVAAMAKRKLIIETLASLSMSHNGLMITPPLLPEIAPTTTAKTDREKQQRAHGQRMSLDSFSVLAISMIRSPAYAKKSLNAGQ